MNVEKLIKTSKEIPIKQRSIIHLQMVSNMITEQINNALKPFDVSLQQFNVLRILRGQKGKPANLSTISERMVSKMSNTTRLVDKLIKKEYVERQVCASNRRKVEIRITKNGLAALEEIDKVLLNKENDLTKSFTDEDLKQLNNLLDKF
ncbi:MULTISPECIES: MarR family winged helix-turn-helix transcriptional regulator [Flavobacteriaceae]|uniref:MarR family winged helix-turn-helix transcriptional regulator n=1 Tax=Flavobacteriaceae TaxID=49546 RepID=UPI0010AEABC1|nr:MULTISPECIES: MarR family transcriptional regulator [Flavobacteriaceae]NJB35938.1 MarR family transcriptional regulator [Croceivirga sp. JEA036]TKD59075.1 MarR family transcriptional regulator [Flavobacterium sp. ASW18X]